MDGQFEQYQQPQTETFNPNEARMEQKTFQTPKFSLDGLSAGLAQEVRQRAEMNGTEQLVNPLEKIEVAQGFQFHTPTAQQFLWKTGDEEVQQIINTFADNCGLCLDAFLQGNYPASQEHLNYALTMAGQLPESEQRWAITNHKDLKAKLEKANAHGLSAIQNQNLQQAPQASAQQNQQPQPAAPLTMAQAHAQANIKPAAPANVPAPTWKAILSKLPLIRVLIDKMPSHPSMYDSILNMTLGANWKKYKGLVTFALITGGAALTYFTLLRPLLNKKLDDFEEEKPRRRRNPRRRRKNVASKRKRKNRALDRDVPPPSKPKRRRAKKPVAPIETPESNDGEE